VKQILNYNIHDILKFQIVRNKRRDIVKDLNLSFSFFEVEDEISEPDIVLNIGKFVPSNENCYVICNKYYIKENYFYCKDQKGRAKWEVEIFGFEEEKTLINFNGVVFNPKYPLMRDLFPQTLILRPLIEYKLSKKGYFLIHSGGISKDGMGYVLAGRGGAFKTSLIMDFVRRKGFDFLGDDRVIISKNEVLSFPMFFIGFNYRTKYLPTEDLQGVLGRIRLIRYLEKTTIDGTDTSITRASALKSLFFISKTNNSVLSKKNLSLKKAVNKLIINNKLEDIGSGALGQDSSSTHLEYMLLYSSVFSDSQIATYWDDLRESLEEILSGIAIYEIEISESYDLNIFNQVFEYVEKAI
jgi:hypothetical protein